MLKIIEFSYGLKKINFKLDSEYNIVANKVQIICKK